MTNALLPIFGGPAGRYARPTGPFFQPLPWAIGIAAVIFAVVYLRHLPCITVDPNEPVDAYVRLCYSDIMAHYPHQHWANGVKVLGQSQLGFAPLVGLLITVSSWLAQVLEWRFDAPAHDYVGLSGFFGATTIVLFACLLILVVATTLIAQRQGRGWSALTVTASPLLLAVGLLSWDLLGLSLSALGMLQLVSRRHIEAGIALGLAVCASAISLAFLLGITISFALAAAWRELARVLAPAVVVIVLVHLPQSLVSPGSVYAYYRALVDSPVSYGSVPYLFVILGQQVREAGPLLFGTGVLLLSIIVAWLYVTKRRPAPADLALVIMLLFALLAPAYPPQTGLWLLLALFLSRGVDPLFWLFTGVQVAHYVAVWARLAGHLSAEKSGPAGLYYLAVLIRFLVEVLLLAFTTAALADRPGTKAETNRPADSEAAAQQERASTETEILADEGLVSSQVS